MKYPSLQGWIEGNQATVRDIATALRNDPNLRNKVQITSDSERKEIRFDVRNNGKIEQFTAFIHQPHLQKFYTCRIDSTKYGQQFLHETFTNTASGVEAIKRFLAANERGLLK